MSAATLHAGRFVLSLQRPLIMGILNVTPDSFSDGGRYLLPDAARARAEAMLAEGADLLDIGGESTRPNAPLVSEQEEIDRVLPVLEALRDYPVPISLDTRRTAVMRAGLALGVDLINDVAALEDEGAIAAVAASAAAVCLMHKQGTPQTMQQAPQYRDVVAEVIDYLAARAHAAQAGGIAASRLLVDPGFGFGKTVEHNYALLARLGECARLRPLCPPRALAGQHGGRRQDPGAKRRRAGRAGLSHRHLPRWHRPRRGPHPAGLLRQPAPAPDHRALAGADAGL